MTNTNTEITAESLVQRVQRLLYPAQSSKDMILEHALADFINPYIPPSQSCFYELSNTAENRIP